MNNFEKINREPLVSILMLTYNRAHYIPEAINSVLSQTYQNWELIIIDDGSTDDTSSVVKSYHDSRITYIEHPTNRGLFISRKESLLHASGTYIAILDSDDLWLNPDKLKRQVSELEANPACAVVGTFINLINEAGAVVKKNHYHTTDNAIRKNILMRNQFANSSVLIRKSMLDKTDGYRNFAIAEDFDLFLQLGYFGTFLNIPEYLTAYRVHHGNISSSRLKATGYILTILKLHKDAYPGYYCSWVKFTLYRLYLATRQLI